MTQRYLTLLLSLFTLAAASGQNLPLEMHFSADGHRLITGGTPAAGFYDESVIRTIELEFPQSNYWQLLLQNYDSKNDIPATMTVDGVVYDSVGVRFKGSTSYFMNNSDKKSFSITLDYTHDSQDIMGYKTLNLNDAYLDPSFVREVMYLHQSRYHIPSAKGNFVWLKLNGQDWGVYNNIQQLNGDYIQEWFLSDNGTRWRCERTTGGGPGGPGGGFGAGKSSLNWLGADTSQYKLNYTLKTAHKENPWDELVQLCDVLNNTPLTLLEDSVKNYLDVDRALWFLAHEIMFTDDDSYVWKGGMDYYIYWDPETGRITPIEYDGNTCMDLQNASSWSIFYRENDTKYPLMNKLFKVPALRQRYLAHVRTMLDESFTQSTADSLIDAYYSQIDSLVEADPKKIYSYDDFLNNQDELKAFFEERRTFLLNNAEIAAPSPEIGTVSMYAAGAAWGAPAANEQVWVSVPASAAAGIETVRLYYATGLTGPFERTDMFDDGAHNDGAAADGVYGGAVPGFSGGSHVRFYVEAVSANTAGTVAYAPKGAEHDVFYYQVLPDASAATNVTINEIMADNTATVTDPQGEYEDWIELFNLSDQPVQLGGFFLSDNAANLAKWQFPGEAIIPGNGYLIVWADEDGSQNGLHASFKLSSGGETLYLVGPDTTIIQEITFGQQEPDMGYARIPNGTGNFVIQGPTFNGNNEGFVSTNDIVRSTLHVFPNPGDGRITVSSDRSEPRRIEVYNLLGVKVLEQWIQNTATFDLRNAGPGIFYIKSGNEAIKVVSGKW